MKKAKTENTKNEPKDGMGHQYQGLSGDDMKTKEYKYIEYTDDHDFAIANVVMDGEKIVSVKLTESCLTNRVEYIELTTFMNTIAPMPWKYDDNDQACADWYKGHTEVEELQCNGKITTT